MQMTLSGHAVGVDCTMHLGSNEPATQVGTALGGVGPRTALSGHSWHVDYPRQQHQTYVPG